MKKTLYVWLGVVMLMTLVGCGGLPKQLREQGKKQEGYIAEARTFLAEYETKLPGLTAGENAWLTPYAEREGWAKKVADGKAEVERLAGVYTTALQPLLKANDSDSEQKVNAEIQRINQGLRDAKDLARYPATRAGELTKCRAELPQLKEKAIADFAAFGAISDPLQTEIAAAKGRHPGRAADIDSRTAVAVKLAADLKAANDVLLQQAGNHEGGRETDYAAFGDNAATIAKGLESIKEEDQRIRTQLGELDVSWSRTLLDMKQRYFLEVAQVSWDEDSDWDTEYPYTRPAVEVDYDTFNQAAALADDGLLASYGPALFSASFRPVAPAGLLAKLNLSEATAKDGFEAWSSDSAEYWINEWRVDTYHKYLEEKNGQTTETDWIAVDEDDYAENIDNLGMTISVKPYGKFADEVDDTPAPVGMAYVGNEKYGQWKSDSSGNSFWEFYGQCMFVNNLLGANYSGYYRDDWDSYRKTRDEDRPYYGGTAAAPRYGSRGSTIAQSGRFTGSTFTKTGGHTRAAASMRTAGVSARGGGPGGGGK